MVNINENFGVGNPLTFNYYDPAPAGDSVAFTLGQGEPVPEPGTWAAAALLAGGAVFTRWRKRAKVS